MHQRYRRVCTGKTRQLAAFFYLFEHCKLYHPFHLYSPLSFRYLLLFSFYRHSFIYLSFPLFLLVHASIIHVVICTYCMTLYAKLYVRVSKYDVGSPLKTNEKNTSVIIQVLVGIYTCSFSKLFGAVKILSITRKQFFLNGTKQAVSI